MRCKRPTIRLLLIVITNTLLQPNIALNHTYVVSGQLMYSSKVHRYYESIHFTYAVPFSETERNQLYVHIIEPNQHLFKSRNSKLLSLFDENSTLTLSLSLSHTLYLQFHQIEPFIAAISTRISNIPR